MADIWTSEKRSEVMSHIRGRDTSPELLVRSLLHGMGYRFRLHVSYLPGKPDIVLRRHGVVINVHGCFWHQHRSCKDACIPKTRTAWWMEKLQGNVERDRRNVRALRKLGWRVLTIWECELRKPLKLKQRLYTFLNGKG